MSFYMPMVQEQIDDCRRDWICNLIEEDWTQKEIAEEMGISISKLKSTARELGIEFRKHWEH